MKKAAAGGAAFFGLEDNNGCLSLDEVSNDKLQAHKVSNDKCPGPYYVME